jgi:hypothetical protein
MLRLYKADLSHDVTIPTHREPPRPTIVPRARALARPGTRTLATATQVDSGMEPDRTFRFASTETIGILDWASVQAFLALYEAGGAFKVDTDLIGPPGTNVATFDALWDEQTVPQFPPAANGQGWYMDLAIRMREEP